MVASPRLKQPTSCDLKAPLAELSPMRPCSADLPPRHARFSRSNGGAMPCAQRPGHRSLAATLLGQPGPPSRTLSTRSQRRSRRRGLGARRPTRAQLGQSLLRSDSCVQHRECGAAVDHEECGQGAVKPGPRLAGDAALSVLLRGRHAARRAQRDPLLGSRPPAPHALPVEADLRRLRTSRSVSEPSQHLVKSG